MERSGQFSPAAGRTWPQSFSIDDLLLLERLAREEMDRIDIEDARAALKEAEEKGTISLEEAKKRLGL